MSVLPYGGIMTAILDKELEQQRKIQERDPVLVNINGKQEDIRFEALRIRGVDNLSTSDVQNYVDYYINPKRAAGSAEEVAIEEADDLISVSKWTNVKVEWINDSCVNVVFGDDEIALNALKCLSISSNMSFEVADNVQEREAKSFGPTRKTAATKPGVVVEGDADLEQDLMVDEQDDDEMTLYIRQSFQSDRKVRNAKDQSRYYLLHGEPQRRPYRRNNRGDNYRNRDTYRPRSENRSQQNDDEEDLFAGKLDYFRHPRERRIVAEAEDKWKSDKFDELANRDIEMASNGYVNDHDYEAQKEDDDDLFPDFKPSGNDSRNYDSRRRNRSRSPPPYRDRSRSPQNRGDLSSRIGAAPRRRAHDLF